MNVWTVKGTTESGDDWQFTFNRKPSPEEVEAVIQKDEWLKEEWEAECIQGWDTVEDTVIELPEVQS